MGPEARKLVLEAEPQSSEHFSAIAAAFAAIHGSEGGKKTWGKMKDKEQRSAEMRARYYRRSPESIEASKQNSGRKKKPPAK